MQRHICGFVPPPKPSHLALSLLCGMPEPVVVDTRFRRLLQLERARVDGRPLPELLSQMQQDMCEEALEKAEKERGKRNDLRQLGPALRPLGLLGTIDGAAGDDDMLLQLLLEEEKPEIVHPDAADANPPPELDPRKLAQGGVWTKETGVVKIFAENLEKTGDEDAESSEESEEAMAGLLRRIAAPLPPRTAAPPKKPKNEFGHFGTIGPDDDLTPAVLDLKRSGPHALQEEFLQQPNLDKSYPGRAAGATGTTQHGWMKQGSAAAASSSRGPPPDSSSRRTRAASSPVRRTLGGPSSIPPPQGEQLLGQSLSAVYRDNRLPTPTKEREDHSATSSRSSCSSTGSSFTPRSSSTEPILSSFPANQQHFPNQQGGILKQQRRHKHPMPGGNRASWRIWVRPPVPISPKYSPSGGGTPSENVDSSVRSPLASSPGDGRSDGTSKSNVVGKRIRSKSVVGDRRVGAPRSISSSLVDDVGNDKNFIPYVEPRIHVASGAFRLSGVNAPLQLLFYPRGEPKALPTLRGGGGAPVAPLPPPPPRTGRVEDRI